MVYVNMKGLVPPHTHTTTI